MPTRIFWFWFCSAVTWNLTGCAGDAGSTCPDCDDRIACTLDACLQPEGRCQHNPDDGLCGPDQRCDPDRGCVAIGDCVFDADCDDADACTVDTCEAGACVYQGSCACLADADCADQDACTLDVCSAGQCMHQNTCDCVRDDDCDDQNACTDDACNQGACAYTDNGAACDDHDACTRGDACAGGACAAGSEACCADGTDNDADGSTDCADADCVGDPDCGNCQPVAAPDPVPMAPLPGEAAPGRAEATAVNGFDDDYLYDSSGLIKVGTRRQWGGTIVFFGQSNGSPGVNATNTIDANDTGREVQVAFYDPDRQMQDCAWDASCASSPSSCPFSITYLGWNPVQGGNRCNRGSGVESLGSADGVQTVNTVPLFWNPNWDRQDCSDAACNDPNMRERRSDVRVIQRLRFVRTHVVELEYTVVNLSDLNHRAGGQEMPTVYTANGRAGTPDLWRLFDSQGNQIAIDQPGNDGFFYKNFTSPGGWACMLNDNASYGVGLFTENRLSGMQGWQNRALPFNNFRPLFSFGIPSHGTVMARAYLLIGSQATIASEAAWLDGHLAPFGWLDEPTVDASVSGVITVRGWALDNKGVSRVEAVVDGGSPTVLSVGGSRPDVCLVWPAYPGCPNVGYSGSLDTAGLSECQHLLEIRAIDTDGNMRTIARQRISVTH
jgi:hypothetical protein